MFFQRSFIVFSMLFRIIFWIKPIVIHIHAIEPFENWYNNLFLIMGFLCIILKILYPLRETKNSNYNFSKYSRSQNYKILYFFK